MKTFIAGAGAGLFLGLAFASQVLLPSKRGAFDRTEFRYEDCPQITENQRAYNKNLLDLYTMYSDMYVAEAVKTKALQGELSRYRADHVVFYVPRFAERPAFDSLTLAGILQSKGPKEPTNNP